MAYEPILESAGGESERAAHFFRDIDAYVNKGGKDLEQEHLAIAQSDEEKCMSSEHFGRLAWQFKRVSGSSGFKV